VKQYDNLIVGGGPGGYTAAHLLAAQGKTVALFEKKKLGGTCLHVGCVPTKLLQQAAVRYHALTKDGKSWGLEVPEVKFNFETVVARLKKTVTVLEMGIASMLKTDKVEVVTGEATVKASDLVSCNGEDYKGKALVLANGSRPRQLPSFPVGGDIVTSDELLTQPRLPKSLLVVGAGVMGIELAGLYAQLGVKVRVGDILPTLIPTMDADLAQMLLNSYRKIGVEFELGVPEVKRKDEELVLVSVGRANNLDQAGIPSLGLKVDKGKIHVDGQLRTSVPGVWAIGDLSSKYPYAHSAYEHARIVAESFVGSKEEMNDHKVPHAMFAHPEMAGVGMTEAEARAACKNLKVLKNPMAANSKARILGDIQGFLKLLVDGDTGKILGVQIAGPEATDLIGEACLIISKGLTLEDLKRTLHPHPTLNEIFYFH
jgi:dihydrolipoamide dehydrogenase